MTERKRSRGKPVEMSRSGAELRRRKTVRFAAVLATLAAAGAAYWYWPRTTQTVRAGGRPTVPVSIAVAKRQDLPIYLTGIGSVQASYTVRINSQVEGKLQEVLFTEGQRVKKGDVLAKLDPPLFPAALPQAHAPNAQHHALLDAAQKNYHHPKHHRLRA